MSTNPKIAVLIPTWNQAYLLPSLFNSLLEQDYDNLFIHVSNDASTDNTSEIMRNYIEKLSKRFTVIMTNHLFNLGLEGRQNMRFLSSEIPEDCDLVSIIEGDDFIKDTSRFNKQIKILQNEGVGAVHSDVSALYQDGSICEAFWKKNRISQTGDPKIPTGKITEHLKICNFIFTCSLLVKKDLYLKAFNYDLFTKLNIFLGDYAGILRLSTLTDIEYIQDPLSVYRVLNTSSSHSNRDRVVRDTVRLQQLADSGELFKDLCIQ